MALADNLTAYWPCDEASGDLLDSHGANDLTDTNTVGSATGKINNGRDFEKDNSEYFTIADNTDMSVGDIDFSFAGWVKFETLDNYQDIFSKNDNSSQLEYGIVSDPDFNDVRFYVYNSSFGQTIATWGSGLSTGTWYFVAGGHSAADNVVWVSVNAGTPVTAAHSTGVANGTAPFRFGARGNGSLYLDGVLDEWGFWKRDIRSDLSELYNSGSGRDYSYITGGGGGGNRRRRSIICGAQA